MAQIALAEFLLDAAICPRCPGGFKIYPASALASHIEQHDKEKTNGWFTCVDCDEPFHHMFNENRKKPSIWRCGSCMMKNQITKREPVRLKRRKRGGVGVEKQENIDVGRSARGSYG